jgi:hypothetical protein
MERLTTGDFIGFSCLDMVFIELASNFRLHRPGQRAFRLRHPVGNTRLCREFRLFLPFCALAGRPQIYNLSHSPPFR